MYDWKCNFNLSIWFFQCITLSFFHISIHYLIYLDSPCDVIEKGINPNHTPHSATIPPILPSYPKYGIRHTPRASYMNDVISLWRNLQHASFRTLKFCFLDLFKSEIFPKTGKSNRLILWLVSWGCSLLLHNTGCCHVLYEKKCRLTVWQCTIDTHCWIDTSDFCVWQNACVVIDLLYRFLHNRHVNQIIGCTDKSCLTKIRQCLIFLLYLATLELDSSSHSILFCSFFISINIYMWIPSYLSILNFNKAFLVW